MEANSQRQPLNIKAELEELRRMHLSEVSQSTVNILLLGQVGVGKTELCKTARAPILIDSFDPGGTKHLGEEIKKGRIIVDSRYENEDSSHPQAYSTWEREFLRRREIGLFSQIGTYVIDSFTMWLEALKNAIAVRKGRAEKLLQLQDWQVMGNVLRDMVLLATSLPCDFILTGHLLLVKEEVSGRMIARFNTIPSLQVNIPLLFDEIYILQTEEKADGVERRLLTSPTGRYEARTRIGAHRFSLYEKPDIKYLLNKAGYPAEDKA